MIAGYHRSRI